MRDKASMITDVGSWEEQPEVIPVVSWSDLTLFMVSTPSPYTKENLKVNISLCFYIIKNNSCIICRHGKACLMVIIF